MTDIVDFLTARLDEDEAAAQATTPTPVPGRWRASRDKHAADGAPLFLVQGEDPHDPGTTEYASTEIIVYSAEWQTEAEANLQHIARHDPARVLAEVAAKRAIIAEHKHVPATDPRTHNFGCEICAYDRGDCVQYGWGWCNTVRLLAAPYADHPDYKQEWSVE